MISEPAARSLQVMAWPRTGARGGGSSSSSVLGQALLKSSLKSPFFQEFGNVVCGVCTPLSPPGIIKTRTVVSRLNFGNSFLQRQGCGHILCLNRALGHFRRVTVTDFN